MCKKKSIIRTCGVIIVTCYVGTMLINVDGQSYILNYMQDNLLYKDTKCYELYYKLKYIYTKLCPHKTGGRVGVGADYPQTLTLMK